jgi:hypothetical protein
MKIEADPRGAVYYGVRDHRLGYGQKANRLVPRSTD